MQKMLSHSRPYTQIRKARRKMLLGAEAMARETKGEGGGESEG